MSFDHFAIIWHFRTGFTEADWNEKCLFGKTSRLLFLRYYLYRYLLAAAFLLCLAAAITIAYFWLHRCEECRAQQSQRRLTFITVNNVYQLDGVAGGIKGGLNRLRTLRTWIERDAPNAILLHAGDFLAPSLTSKVFKGEHMIDVLNHMDGDGAAFDKRMFVVFGNHEFDDSRCDTENAVLNKRVADSQFTWLNANLDFSGCSGMKSLASESKVVRDGVVSNVNGIKLGLFGIGLTPGKMDGSPASDKYPALSGRSGGGAPEHKISPRQRRRIRRRRDASALAGRSKSDRQPLAPAASI